MPSPTFFTGFEHKIVAACGGTVVPPSEMLWNTVTGSPVAETTTVHHGGAALRLNPAGTVENVLLDFVSGAQRRVLSMGFRIVTLPTLATNLLIFQGNDKFIQLSTAGVLSASAGAGTVTGPTITTGVWYILDMDINSTANPHTLDWRVDGVVQTQATDAVAAQDMTGMLLGSTSAISIDWIMDCLTLSSTGADYPMGHLTTLGYLPNEDADITQVSTGAFQDGAAAAISGANPAWDNLLAIGDAAETTFVQQTAIAAAGYINVGFAPSSEASAPVAVMAEVAMRADSATTTNGQVQIDDGGTLDSFTGLFDPSEATNVNRWNLMLNKPSGGSWTTAAFNDLKMRIGYSTDANPDVHFVGLMFEALFSDAVPPVLGRSTFDPIPFYTPKGRSL